MNELFDTIDSAVSSKSDLAALTMRQWLEPVEGKDAVIFPPTYPIETEKAGYNIDRFADGFSVCQIDSVGSQANRMEPIFLRQPYSELVPSVTIKARVDGIQRVIRLLEAGHRAADAIVRFSSLGPQIHEAFRQVKDSRDATQLARIAPTSLVFGVWDSRATQVKLPRVVRSVIRAFDLRELHRSAQYSTIAGELLEGPEVEVTTKGVKAELGLAHVPSVLTHGGIQVQGEIRRDAALNLAAIRSLSGAPTKEQETAALRRYILGLALVSLSADQDLSLREGCQLTVDLQRPAVWQLVRYNGLREPIEFTHQQALDYAIKAAKEFGVGPEVSGEFEAALASRIQSLSEKDRKALLRQGPVTLADIERLKSKAKNKANNRKDAEQATEQEL